MNPWLAISLVLAALGLLIGCVRLAQLTSAVSPELSRKSVHVGMGFVCLGFPWLFQEAWPVFLLAAIAMLLLGALRTLPFLNASLGCVMGGVGRRSLGEFYFPAAVATVFWLSKGDPILFCIPVLTLAVGDAVGALIGIRYGQIPFRTDEGYKSVEGSASLFLATFLSCHVPLLLFSEIGRAESLLIGLTVGLVVAVLEAIAWRGQDNVIIPLGVFFLLKLYLPLDALALLTRFGVLLALLALVIGHRNRLTLSDSGALTAALAGYGIWAFGGWLWLGGALILYLCWVSLPAFPKEAKPIQSLHAVTRVMTGGYFWLLLAEMTSIRWVLIPFLLCFAAHTGNIIVARLRVLRPELGCVRITVIGFLIPSLCFSVWLLVAVWMENLPLWVIAMPLPTVGISVLVFYHLWPSQRETHLVRAWCAEALLAIFASLIPSPFLWKNL